MTNLIPVVDHIPASGEKSKQNSESNSNDTQSPEAETTTKNNEIEAFKTFEAALSCYKPESILFSFNGGKDCTVVLHMLRKYYETIDLKVFRIPVLYIQPEHAFEEVDQFVEKCKKIYNIELIHCKGNIKVELERICKENPHIKAVFMGSRRTDPYCDKLTVMQETDPGWPPLLRINPILDWTCRDVWNYILINKVPYCCLYDRGYTSLGNKVNTVPNPHLQVVDPITGAISYLPAYKLMDDFLERSGRK